MRSPVLLGSRLFAVLVQRCTWGALLTCNLAVAGALPGLPLPPPACPPNTSCVPGIPPIVPPIVPPTTPPGTCGPGNGGDTCGGTGPASSGSPHGINLGAGNPINIINGNKYQREVDLPALPGLLGLEIVRHYNSAFSGPGGSTNLLGRGWKLSYETDLHVVGKTLQIVQADGARIIFNRDPNNPSLCASTNPADGTLAVRNTVRGEEFVWRWTNGRELSFNTRGKLVQILAPGGQFVSLQHDARGLLVRVTDPQGRSLHLSYPDKAHAGFRGVQSIKSPVGSFSYSYGSQLPKGSSEAKASVLANLVKVQMPTGARYYHYENAQFPTLLTGISELATGSSGKLDWQRVSTYGYDINGKGNLSVKGYPARLQRDGSGQLVSPPVLAAGTGQEQVTLDTSVAGQTTVTNGVGQKTVYKHALVGGQYRFLEVRGPGCANCGDTNVRYGYDKLGRLTDVTSLDPSGKPLATNSTELDALGRALRISKIAYRDGKPGARQLQVRYEYAGNATQPVLIAKPSVVAGKELVTRISYNERGLPLSMTESGFVPTLDGLNAATPIERTVAYRYNVYGERTEIDGPLSNTGQEADMTRIDYDPRTKLPRQTSAPGNVVAHVVERDAALRPQVLRWTDGATVRTTTIRSNWRGQPEEIRIDNGVATQVEHYRYDVNGRLMVHIQADGKRVPLPAAAPADGQQLAGLPPQRDWANRPVAWQDPNGATTLQAAWGEPGTAAQGTILALTSANGRALRLLDDFGRVAAIRNPGQGWQIARYDAAGRLLAMSDARGARQVASYDAAGRLQQLQRFAPGAGTPEQTLTYRYKGLQLIEQTLADADGTRHTVSDYDSGGRLLRETLRITPAGKLAAAMPRAIEISQSLRYDTQGRLVARTLTDASGASTELAVTLDASGQPVRLATVGALPAALGGERVIVRNVEWQALPGGPFATRVVHADGSSDSYDPVSVETAPAGRFQHVADSVAPMAEAGRLPGSPGRDVDAAGLPAAIDTPLREQRLHWNAAGQLAQTLRADGSTRHIYDARGQRVVKLVSEGKSAPQVTVAFYDGTRLLAETDAGGQARFAYAYLGYRPLAQIDLRRDSWWSGVKTSLFGAPARNLHTDRAGKVLSMTEAGQTVWEAAGPALSAPRLLRVASERGKGIHQPLRYVGQYHDDESALAYHGARFFDPASGRFLSPDPAGVADAVSELPANLLLDLYAYAGGRPDEFFDPDGAARVRYFAITTNQTGAALGSTVGFVKARWAFIVDNVQAGGDGSALGQKRNQYAANGTGLLVDIKGNFLGANQSSRTWSGATTVPNDFTTHYGNNLISLTEFTVEMDDDDAATLIASYIPADKQALFGASCPARAALLPEIRFAGEEVPIKVTSAAYNNGAGNPLARMQRIVECGAAATNDIVERRLQKYNYAAMLLESIPSQIYKDCSANGCPGQALNNTTLAGYVASYGQTQFIGTTMVETLKKLRNNTIPVNAAGRAALRLDDAALWASVNQQQTRAAFAVARFNAHTATTPSWANATAAARTSFMTGTGLGAAAAETLWNDINRWKQNPTANLNGEARAAVGTKVLMSDPAVQTYLMDIFRDSAAGGRFSIVSLALMRHSYDSVLGQVNVTNTHPPTLNGAPNPAWVTRQRQIEIELGMRTGREHNGDYNGTAKNGTFAQVRAADSATAGRQYGHRLMNAFEYPVVQPANPNQQQPTGDYFSLRCTADLPANIPRGGLQITPLTLP